MFVFSTFRDERFGAEAIESVDDDDDDDGLQTPKKKIISVRTNAVLLPMMTPVAVGSIDTDRIADAYESSSSLNRTHQIEVQRVFEVADAAR